MSGITFSEMMQSPVITRIVNQISTPLSLFQQFLGRMSGDNSVASESVHGRNAGWDLFDPTRQFAGARGPMSPPRRVAKKLIGHTNAQLMRSHESIVIYDEEVFRTRPLGGQIGSNVDLRGQQHIIRQIKFMVQRFRNQREFAISRMFRGGFNLKADGDNYDLIEYDATATDSSPINMQIPADNLDRLDLGTGSDILTDWSIPSANIIGQLLRVNKAFTRLHGRALRHIWINSTTYENIQNNTGIRAIGGDAFEIFEFMQHRSGKSLEGIPDSGFTVVFRAMPLYLFHVYDGVLSSDGKLDGDSVAETSLLVPDNRIIALPEVDGEWEGLIDGSEIIRENLMAQGRIVQGFHAWSTPVIDPPGREAKFVDNYLPVLYVPKCVTFGNVGP